MSIYMTIFNIHLKIQCFFCLGSAVHYALIAHIGEVSINAVGLTSSQTYSLFSPVILPSRKLRSTPNVMYQEQHISFNTRGGFFYVKRTYSSSQRRAQLLFLP